MALCSFLCPRRLSQTAQSLKIAQTPHLSHPVLLFRMCQSLTSFHLNSFVSSPSNCLIYIQSAQLCHQFQTLTLLHLSHLHSIVLSNTNCLIYFQLSHSFQSCHINPTVPYDSFALSVLSVSIVNFVPPQFNCAIRFIRVDRAVRAVRAVCSVCFIRIVCAKR